MLTFDGVYATEDLSNALAVIEAVLPETQRASLTFQPSGYKTTVECQAKRLKVTVEIPVDWARGYARRELTDEQISNLRAELAQYRPTVWVRVADGPITLRQPTETSKESTS